MPAVSDLPGVEGAYGGGHRPVGLLGSPPQSREPLRAAPGAGEQHVRAARGPAADPVAELAAGGDGEHAPSVGHVGQVRLTAFVKGRVQGVGYRWWTRARALELGLVGSATNLRDGRVEVVAEGPEPDCRALLALLPDGPGRVDFVAERWGEPRGEQGFTERSPS